MNNKKINTIAGMVTLYNSDSLVFDNIDTYIEQIGKLYIVDNSEVKNGELIDQILKKYSKVEYISNAGNKGIAFALNKGASAAIRDSFSHLLMMDDDSQAPYNLVENLFLVYTSENDLTVGIVAAQPDQVARSDRQDVITVITSGSLLNLDVYKKVGPFLDTFFIDWVDHEYCFRLRSKGYRIIIDNRIKFKHRLGIYKQINVLSFFAIRWRSHNPKRIYYKFRNSLYTLNIYKKELPFLFVASVLYELVEDIFKAVFLEKNKKSYILSIAKGIRDACKGRLGALN